MKQTFTLLSLASLLFLATCGSAKITWHETLESAQAEAAKTKTTILVNFTGSDWCTWCQKLATEVFDAPDFASDAGQHFTFVKLDYPRTIEQPEATKQYNEKLMTQFGIEGFPTILLLDASGKAYARTGYQEGGAKAYLTHLLSLSNQRVLRDTLLKTTIRETDPAKKIDALVSAISNLSAWGILASYPELKGEVIRLDADDARGLRSKYSAEGDVGDIVQKYFPKRDFAGALTDLEKLQAKYPKGEASQQVWYYMAVCAAQMGRTDSAKLHLRSAIAAAPQSSIAPAIQRSLESLDAQP